MQNTGQKILSRWNFTKTVQRYNESISIINSENSRRFGESKKAQNNDLSFSFSLQLKKERKLSLLVLHYKPLKNSFSNSSVTFSKLF